MPRGRDRRLARLAARSLQEKSAEDWHRAALEARVAAGAELRRLLPQFGIDPATVTMLRVCDEAAAELNGPPPPASASPQEAPSGDPFGKIARLAQRYRDDPRIDFANASLAQVLAWCIARADALASSEGGNDGKVDFCCRFAAEAAGGR